MERCRLCGRFRAEYRGGQCPRCDKLVTGVLAGIKAELAKPR